MVGVSLLGPVEVVRPTGRQPVPPGRTAELLSRLALDAGATVTTERLIDDLWGDAAGAQARNTVQSTVSRLRRVLGDPAAVTGSPTGYRLIVAPADVDALAVVTDAARAAEARRAGSPAAVLEICTAALARFRGEPMAGAGDGAWLVAHRVRLDELRLTLAEWQIEARLGGGAGAEVVGPLEELVRLHPGREGLWRSLMTALYRDGRQADALAAYTRLRTHLGDELGLLPSPESSLLEQQILRHDPALDSPPGSGFPDPGSARRVPTPQPAAPGGNLPALVSSLVGRNREVAEVADLIGGGHALVTLVGPAGVGKTRLAVEVGRRSAASGGAWLARLEAVHDEAGVVQAVAEALGVTEATEAALGEWLRGDEVLLILDNCEQVTAAVGLLVGRLLHAAPATRVLCTSQLPLGVEGEEALTVKPLGVDEAAALFVERARRWRRTGSGGEAEAEVVALCRALDGLPLAIELAAARAATLPVAEINRRLDDRFALLHDPTGRRSGRHQALGTALAWSYDLLQPDDQRLLQLLAAFPGGAPLEGVEAVAASVGPQPEGAPLDGTVLDGLGRLVDRSLVSVAIGGGDSGDTRYHLLDSVRAFALDRLRGSALEAGVLRGQASWYAELAEAAAAGLRGPDQGRFLAIARQERANLTQALDWAAAHDPAQALSMANGFGWAWFLLGDGPAGVERLRRAREAAEQGGAGAPVDTADNRCLAAWLGSANDIAAARVEADAALELGRSIGEPVERRCRVALAFVLIQQRLAGDVLETVKPLLEPPVPPTPAPAPAPAGLDRNDAWYGAAAWRLAAHAWLVLGDAGRAGEAGGRAEELLAGVGDDWALAHLANLRGVLAQTAGRYGEATGHLRAAVEASGRLGFRAAQALHLTNLARSLELGGDGEAAVGTYGEAVEAALAARDLRIVALARTGLGRLLRARGDRSGAEEAITAADTWFARAGGGEGALLAGALVAALAAEAGDGEALARLDGLATLTRSEGEHEAELVALDALARHRAGVDPEAARALLAAADRLAASGLVPVGDGERVDAAVARSLLAAP